MESFVEFVEHQPHQLCCFHCCNGETSSTRIRRRTCHSKIATHDEFDREDAFGRVFFKSIKPGEDLYGYQDPGILLPMTIDRGNLRNHHHQVIQKRIMVELGLLKSGKVELWMEHDRSGKPETTSWDILHKS